MTDSTANPARADSHGRAPSPDDPPGHGPSADGSTRILGIRVPFYYGWVILGMAAMAAYASAPGQTYAFTVFLSSFQEELGISDTVISLLYLSASMFAAFTVIIVGRLYDRFGPRIMLVAVGILLGFSALWMSQVSNAMELAIGFAALRTFGQGALSMIPATMVSVWFVRRRGKALAMMMLGGALASGTFPALANGLSGWLGWREAWMAIALIPWLMLIVPAILFVRRSPESMGLQPDGVRAGSARAAAYLNERSVTLRQAMRGRAMWLLMFAGAAQSAIGTSLMFHQISLMEDRGVSAGVAAGLFGVKAATMLVGQFVSGFLCDRYSIRFIVTAGQGLLLVSILFLLAVSSVWQATLYSIILGFSTGFLMNSMQAIWPAYFGRTNLGSIKGMGQWAMMAAAAIGPFPLALSRDLTGSFGAGLFALALLPILSGLAAFFAKRPVKNPWPPMASNA